MISKSWATTAILQFMIPTIKGLDKRVLKRIKLQRKNFPVSGVLGEISRQKDELINPAEYEKRNQEIIGEKNMQKSISFTRKIRK